MNKTEAIFLRMSEEEKRLFTGAANMAGLPLAAWARMVMRQEGQKEAEYSREWSAWARMVMRQEARRQADRQGLEGTESPA